MPRPVTYGRQVRVYLTREHLAEIDREVALTGQTQSQVLRAALTAWYAKPEKPKKRRAVR